MRSLFLFAVASLALTAVAASDKRVVCYFGSWAVYRPGVGKFDIDDIDASICTHAIYTFVGISDNNVKVLDPWQDLPNDYGKDGFGRFNKLRQKNPNLKTLVAIGGWNEGSPNYSKMASNPASRSTFVKNVVAFVKKHNFDGFDLDWEYPAQRGGASSDVQNFSLLVKELREAFDREGLILSAAVGAAQMSASQSYNIREISKHLHFINLMTYDLHGSWERKTGINAPLYASKSESGNDLQLNVDAVVKYWLAQGADPKKLVVGVATYGRSFTLESRSAAHVGAATRGAGSAGPYTREPGMLGYNEICEMQKNEGWTVVWDEERRVPYASKGDQWVGYDNVQSIREKAEYIRSNGLGGAMVWSIETDDFKGICGDTYPIIRTLHHVIRGGPAPSERPTQPPRPTQRPTTQRPTSQTQQPGGNTESHGSGSGECTKAGDMAHPSMCEKFIKCVKIGPGKYQKFVLNCPPGLCFKNGICDWP